MTWALSKELHTSVKLTSVWAGIIHVMLHIVEEKDLYKSEEWGAVLWVSE